MQDFSLHRLSDEDAVRLYEWTERSSSAVLKCTCQQVRRMKTLPELSYAIGGGCQHQPAKGSHDLFKRLTPASCPSSDLPRSNSLFALRDTSSFRRGLRHGRWTDGEGGSDRLRRYVCTHPSQILPSRLTHVHSRHICSG